MDQSVRERHFMDALESGTDSQDVSSTLHHNTSSINDNGTEEPHTSKRTASEAFRHISTSQDVPVIIIDADSDDEEVESTSTPKRSKRTEASTSGGQSDSEASNGEFDADIVFAMDYSSSLSEEELEMEIDFVIKLAESLNVTPGKSKAALVVYGDSAQTVIPFNSGDKNEKKFYVQPGELKTRALSRSKCRRMDLALTKAADNLSAIKPRNQNQHHLVVLITAGKQLTNEECEEENDLLLSASEALSSSSLVLETDFKELGLIVKRPQSLFPFSFFRELTPDKAEGIAFYIKKTIDIDAYAKEQLSSVMLSGIPTGSGLWEKISLCSDVLEGAWYLLYDDQKKPRKPQKPQKIKKLIRESIDNFHSTLVSKKEEGPRKSMVELFPSNAEDETKKTTSDCYKDVRAKLPQLNGEALLEKLSQESEVIYFHVGNSGFLKSLKNVINDHVQNVKIKETVHPFLQNVHWAAKSSGHALARVLSRKKRKVKLARL
ncbi:hypothetical protein OS493_011265 [Desmophyllum pertusum]|uniref:VWFA domain-containing protein n=1 Tax=Desmophyllum pertusum TaxID=174260 RepID=A0A9W9Z294_9CNID|nr:hypothetical protein OS493_011265 [Desmophyllum pertusum]